MKKLAKVYQSVDAKLVKVTTAFSRIRKAISAHHHLRRSSLDKAAEAARIAVNGLELPETVVMRLNDAIIALEQIDFKISRLDHTLEDALREITAYNDLFNGLTPIKYEEKQGMTERYSPILKKIRNEKLKKHKNKKIAYALCGGTASEQKQIKRLIEKRAAQAAHKLARKHDRESNKLRHDSIRAISFSIESAKTAIFNIEERISGTHWKVIHDPKGNLLLRAKKPYNTLEDAQQAAYKYALKFMEDPSALSAYLCPHCGKFHFGHNREATSEPSPATAI